MVYRRTVLCLAPFCPVAVLAQADPLSLPPRVWAARAAQTEIKIVRYNSPYLRYRIHQVDAKGDQTRDVFESQDGTVARLIARDHHPLTPDQNEAERSRLQEMIQSPDAFARHIRGDVSGKKTAVDLIGLMPDAMLYTYTPGQPQRANRDYRADNLPEVVLDFQPNPDWRPPTLPSEALTGLAGRLWIDPRTYTLGRMEGKVIHSVNFGWGMFARIYPGGQLLLEQAHINDQRTIFSLFSQDLIIRAMMVKTIHVNSNIEATGFEPVPAMTYQDAIRTLLATPLTTQP